MAVPCFRFVWVFFASNTLLQGSYWLQNSVTIHFIFKSKNTSSRLQSDPIRIQQTAEQTVGSAATESVDSPNETKAANSPLPWIKEPSLSIPWKDSDLWEQIKPFIYLQTPPKWISSTFLQRTRQPHTKKSDLRDNLKKEQKAKTREKLYITGSSRRKVPSNRTDEIRKITGIEL